MSDFQQQGSEGKMTFQAPKISSHLPDLVDNYISIRSQRLALDKEAASLKETEDDIYKVIVSKMRDEGMSVLGAKNGFVKLKESEEPVPTDWPALYEYIKDTGSFEFLHKRIATVAIKEHVEAGETIPGIGFTTVYKLTVSKS
jgi:hypothetical protein